MLMLKALAIAICCVVLVGCKDKVEIPKPMELTRNSNGFYCHMIIVDHPGPKAQVFEKDRTDPLWFSSVRDAVAYLQLPGEAQNVTAFYVHDMGKATTWQNPQSKDIWIDATKAVYVIGSSKRGGMGAKETVPFSDQKQANKFAMEFGGHVVFYEKIPNEYVLGDDYYKAPNS